MKYLMNKIIFAITLTFWLGLNLSWAASEPESTAAVLTLTPNHKLVLTTTNNLLSVESKANVLQKIIQNLPDNTVLNLVFAPTGHNAKTYSDLLTLIYPVIQEAESNRNVQIRVQLINPQLAQASYEAYANITCCSLDQAFLNFEQDGLLIIDHVPPNLVERLDRNSSIGSNLKATLKDSREAFKNGLKKLSFTGIATSILLTGAGFTAHGPASVYISDGELSLAAIISAALTASTFYITSRHENFIERLYVTGYEVSRSLKESLRFLFATRGKFWNNLRFYLHETNPKFFYGARVFMGVGLYSFALQSTFYYLEDGSAVWNPENIQYMIKSSVLIGAGSAIWSSVTRKLKTETMLSNNLITHLRTGQLVMIGALAASIQTPIEASIFSINLDEAKLLGFGAAGVAVNTYGVKFINKFNEQSWFKILNQKIEAITNSPRALARLIGDVIFEKFAGREQSLVDGFVPPENSGQVNSKPDSNQNQCVRFLAH